VTRNRNSFVRRAVDFVALVFGLAALAVQVIAPICLSGFPAARATGGLSIVLCTAHGFQTVTLDVNGKPIPAAPDNGGSDGLCLMCVAFHSAPLLAVTAALFLAVLLFWRSADRFVNFAPVLLRRAYISFETRGPPAAVRAALS
jgi:hypothetical protein